MNNFKIKFKHLKSKKNTILNHFFKVKLNKKHLKPLKYSKKIFFYHLKNFLKNTDKHDLLIEKLYKSERENKKTKQKLKNILSLFLYNVKSENFKIKQYFYKTKTISVNLYSKLIYFYSSNEYLLISFLKNLKNLPYSILIIYLNRYFRFCRIFKIILNVFISKMILKTSIKHSLSKVRYPNFKYLPQKIKLTTLKNLMKHQLSTIKTTFNFDTLPQGYMEPNLLSKGYKRFNIADISDQKASKKEISNGTQKLKKLRLLNFKKLGSKKIKPQLWKITRKLHNQNSFYWLFKKYWLILDSYKQYKLLSIKQKEFKSLYKNSNLIFSKNSLKRELYINNPINIQKVLPSLQNFERKFDNLNAILNFKRARAISYTKEFDSLRSMDNSKSSMQSIYIYFIYTYYFI